MIVQNVTKCITYVEDVFFYPGMNELTHEVATKLTESPAFIAKIEAGQLKIIGATAKPIPSDTEEAIEAASDVALASMSIPAAIRIINETYNKKALFAFQNEDQRKGVQNAIVAQLAKIDSMNVSEK